MGITTHKWLATASYYDKRYNTIQTVSRLYPSGLEVASNTYDFSGNVTRTKVKQTIGTARSEYNKYMNYDLLGRLINVKQQITGDATNNLVTIASYEYNDLLQVSKKKIHNGTDATTYGYNIDGKLIS